jgi:hypothetical protein
MQAERDGIPEEEQDGNTEISDVSENTDIP